QVLPKPFIVLRVTNGRCAFVFGPSVLDTPSREKQIVWTRFCRDTQTFFLRAPNPRDRKLRRKMNDMNPRLELTREADEHLNRLCFRRWWTRTQPRLVRPGIGFSEFYGCLFDRSRQFRMDQQ